MAEANGQRVTARFPDLAGKTAIVTGTSRGIGCGIAKFLGEQGMRLVLTARSEGQGEAFAATLRETGVDCVFMGADLATPADATRVFQAATAAYERIDLLVNNAAHLKSKHFLELDEENFQHSCERNIRIIYGISRHVAQHMAAAGGGCIIHLSSVGGLRAHQGMAGYDASKGAIDALTRSMSIDLAASGIRVNAVAPGATQSRPLLEAKPASAAHGAHLIPLHRYATVEEIGAAVAFLASDAAAYITGQILYVDGGLTAQLSPPGQPV
ncbi:MAG: glucose 1-dehydrogenase [Verrucomicrobia bacterium]|nr:glucose 1-dehydrogenase [Verrucomicrobiota bacterium]MDA1086287.1 glucose 1-dehydrogenase [Verrucomicrobiota bacterium]